MKWDDWLKSEECSEVLLHCARSILGRHWSRRIIANVLDLGRRSSTSDTAVAESSYVVDSGLLAEEHELAGDLWIFLKERANHVDLCDLIIRDEILAFRNRVINDFLKYLIHIQRCLNPNANDHAQQERYFRRSPFHHYYHNACEVLLERSRQNATLQYCSNRVGAAYAFSSDTLASAPLALTSQQKYGSWPYLSKWLSQALIHKSDVVHGTADYFWHESVKPERLGASYLVPVRELASYVFSHVKTEAEVVSPCSAGGDDSERDYYFPDPAEAPNQHVLIEVRELKQNAREIASAWHPDIRSAFIWKFDEGLTLAEIKAKGISSPQHRVDQAVNQIRDFWTLWCGDVDDGDSGEQSQDLFRYFFESLVSACKKFI